MIKAMADIDNIISELMLEKIPKRDCLIEKVKNGEFISNSKTPWT